MNTSQQKKKMMKMQNTKNYECMHEELLQNHNLQINELQQELGYKKQRIDELKEDNKRMEDKIDEIKDTLNGDIKDCINKLILKSKEGDTELETRLVKIENENQTLKQEIQTIKETQDKNTDRQYTKIAIIISAIAIIVSIITHFI